MRYRLAVFDFDGTLADSFPFFLDAIDVLADSYGFRRIDRGQLDTLRRLDARQMLRHVGLPLWKAPRIGAAYKSMMAEQAHRIPLFPGVPEMLRTLHARGVVLAMLTSNSERNVRAVLGEELAALFSHFQCGSDLFGKRVKLRRLLAASGAERSQILCVGDELRDFEAARQERLDFGAVSWGYTHAQALREQKPAFMFEEPGDIASLLGENRAQPK